MQPSRLQWHHTEFGGLCCTQRLSKARLETLPCLCCCHCWLGIHNIQGRKLTDRIPGIGFDPSISTTQICLKNVRDCVFCQSSCDGTICYCYPRLPFSYHLNHLHNLSPLHPSSVPCAPAEHAQCGQSIMEGSAGIDPAHMDDEFLSCFRANNIIPVTN